MNLATRTKTIYLSDTHAKSESELYNFLTTLSQQECYVLEQLSYLPAKTPLSRVALSIDLDFNHILEALKKLETFNLVSFEEDFLFIHKEMRRQIEVRMCQLEEDFSPSFDFLLQLLRKAPIESLIHWYPIPRGSDNFLDGLIERYLETPFLYLRHLKEVAAISPIYDWIIQKLLKDFSLSTSELAAEFHLDRKELVEVIISLEFHLVSTTKLQYKEGTLHETLFLFDELRDYLSLPRYNKETKDEVSVQSFRPHLLAFSEEMSLLLRLIKLHPLEQKKITSEPSVRSLFSDLQEDQKTPWIERLLGQILSCRFAKIENGKIEVTALGSEWAALEPNRKALSLTRIPSYFYAFSSKAVASEKNMREVEKTLCFIDNAWHSVENLKLAVGVSLEDTQRFKLKKFGKQWRYHLPPLSPSESTFIQEMVEGPLFEGGLVQIGFVNGALFFKLTPFGRSIYPWTVQSFSASG